MLMTTFVCVAVKQKEPDTKGKRPLSRTERSLAMVLALMLVGLACATTLIFCPQNLSDIGTGKDAHQPLQARDLTQVFSQSIAGSYPLRISEEEINAYFEKTLSLRQGGALSAWVSLEQVLVRLENERAEIIMVRKIGSMAFTTSMWVTIEQIEDSRGQVETLVNPHGGPMPFFPMIDSGGRFGRLVVPQGFMHLLKPAYVALAQLYPEEIRLGFEEMSRIRIEDGVLVLDPRFDQGSGLMDF